MVFRWELHNGLIGHISDDAMSLVDLEDIGRELEVEGRSVYRSEIGRAHV